MALQIGPKHVVGIIIKYNLIKYKLVSALHIFYIIFQSIYSKLHSGTHEKFEYEQHLSSSYVHFN